jgi:hypothetical protein
LQEQQDSEHQSMKKVDNDIGTFGHPKKPEDSGSLHNVLQK